MCYKLPTVLEECLSGLRCIVGNDVWRKSPQVRILSPPQRQYSIPIEVLNIGVLSNEGEDSKDGSGIQDERSECLSLSRGRAHLVELEQSEQLYLVTGDRILSPPHCRGLSIDLYV